MEAPQNQHLLAPAGCEMKWLQPCVCVLLKYWCTGALYSSGNGLTKLVGIKLHNAALWLHGAPAREPLKVLPLLLLCSNFGITFFEVSDDGPMH